MSEDIPGMVLQELRRPTDDWREFWKSFIDFTNHFYFYSNHNLGKLQFATNTWQIIMNCYCRLVGYQFCGWRVECKITESRGNYRYHTTLFYQSLPGSIFWFFSHNPILIIMFSNPHFDTHHSKSVTRSRCGVICVFSCLSVVAQVSQEHIIWILITNNGSNNCRI